MPKNIFSDSSQNMDFGNATDLSSYLKFLALKSSHHSECQMLVEQGGKIVAAVSLGGRKFAKSQRQLSLR